MGSAGFEPAIATVPCIGAPQGGTIAHSQQTSAFLTKLDDDPNGKFNSCDYGFNVC